jgi:hypothetical protein
LPGELTPRLQESLVRLGSWMPFRRATRELNHFTGVRVSEATARRLSEQAGADYVAVQTEQVEQIHQQLPAPTAGPELQLLSVDGAFVPLIHREWAEVKTLAVGRVEEPRREKGEVLVHTRELSYFSRSSAASEFTAEALVELHRRGTETAKKVIAVTDGAAWEQSFIDFHRADAVRILDFAHAAEYIAEAGRSLYGEQSAKFRHWLEAQLHRLKTGQPAQVFKPLRQLAQRAKAESKPEALQTIHRSLAYLEQRREMIEYAQFQAVGYPIGSGSVESAHKAVVESRMKQAGMHWQRTHVDPIVALRTIACNDRWEEAWPQIVEQKQKAAEARRRRQREPKPGRQPTPVLAAVEQVLPPSASPVDSGISLVQSTKHTEKPAPGKAKQPYCPPADHPWRRMPIGRARYRPSMERPGAKS